MSVHRGTIVPGPVQNGGGNLKFTNVEVEEGENTLGREIQISVANFSTSRPYHHRYIVLWLRFNVFKVLFTYLVSFVLIEAPLGLESTLSSRLCL